MAKASPVDATPRNQASRQDGHAKLEHQHRHHNGKDPAGQCLNPCRRQGVSHHIRFRRRRDQASLRIMVVCRFSPDCLIPYVGLAGYSAPNAAVRLSRSQFPHRARATNTPNCPPSEASSSLRSGEEARLCRCPVDCSVGEAAHSGRRWIRETYRTTLSGQGSCFEVPQSLLM